MKHQSATQANFLKRDVFIIVALIVALAATFLIIPVSAQEPDVNAAQTAQQKFTRRPFSVWSPTSPVVQLVPESSRATTELMVTRAGNVSSVSIAFDYSVGVVTVMDVRPGSLFDGLTEGVDYIVTTNLNRASPINPTVELPLPSPWPVYTATATTPSMNRRSYINITMINPLKQVIFQNGSVIRIDWQVATNNPGVTTPVLFSILELQDVSGNPLAPCFSTQSTAIDPTCYNLAEMVASGPLSATTATTTTQVLDSNGDGVADDGPIIGQLTIDSRPLGLNFQIALQGLNVNPAFSTTLQSKFDQVDILATQFGYNVPGYVYYQDGRAYVPVAPPYEQLTISRPGYLTALGGNINDTNLYQVELLAGDINGDNVINIFDLTLMANSLNSGILDSTGAVIEPLERMDYTGDQRITITDMALVAGNFRVFGPTPIQ